MKSKLLVAVVVATMVFGMVSTAFAAPMATAFTDVTADADANAAFTLLAAMGVFQGYGDGTVGPNDPITRAQFSAVVVRALNRDKTATAVSTYPTNFTDDAQIPAWARGYVITAQALGIINGYPDGSFRPNDPVKYEEAFKMLLAAMKVYQGVTGPWPTGVLVTADEVGLSDDVVPLVGIPMTRSDMALATYSALRAEYDYDTDEEAIVEGDSLFTEKWEGQWYEETVEGVGSVDLGGVEWDLADDYYLIGVNDIEDLVGLDSLAFTSGDSASDDEVLWIAKDDTAEFVAGTVDGDAIEDEFADENYDLLVLDDGTEIDLADDYTIQINGVDYTVGADADYANLEDAYDDDVIADGDSVKVTLDKDDEAIFIKVTRMDLENSIVMDFSDDDVLDYDSEDEEGTLTFYDADNDEQIIDVDGDTLWYVDGELVSIDDVMDIEDVSAVDIQSEGAEGDYAQKVYIYTETATGEVTEVRQTSSGKYYITLEDADEVETEYRVSGDGYYDEPNDVFETAADSAGLDSATITVGLNADGYVRVVLDSTAGDYVYGMLTSLASDGDPIWVQLGDGTVAKYETDEDGTYEDADFADLDVEGNYFGYFDFQSTGAIDNFVPYVSGANYFDDLADAEDGADAEAVDAAFTYGTVYTTTSDTVLIENEDGTLVRSVKNVLVYDEDGDFIGIDALSDDDDVVYVTTDGTDGENDSDDGRVIFIIQLDF